MLIRNLFITLLLCSAQAGAQTAIIKVNGFPYDSSDERHNVFPGIQFTFNSVSFNGSAEATYVIKLNKGLDLGRAIIGTDTIDFYTRFQNGITYVLEEGCCCAAFILAPENDSNAGKGTLKLLNRTKSDVYLALAGHNSDTVKAGAEKTLFANESAMCLFKPASILIADPEYGAEKFNYRNDEKNYDSLWMESKKLIRYQTAFHFMHREQIEISYSTDKKPEIRLLGYLSNSEYRKRLYEY